MAMIVIKTDSILESAQIFNYFFVYSFMKFNSQS